MSQSHLLTYEIDGLKMGSGVFNFKNRLFFSHPQDPDEYISNAFVVLNRPISLPEGGPNWEPQNKQRVIDADESLRLVATFLSCFHLVNEKETPEIVFDSPSGVSISDSADVMKWVQSGGGRHKDIISKRKKLTEKETSDFLNNTIPLFEKVFDVIEKSNKNIDPLEVGLLLYYRVMLKKDILQDFLNLVTIIESLICDMPDLSYKFAIRTSFFVEPDKSKRNVLFQDLKSVYSARNNLVHGSDMTLFPYADYLKFKEMLWPIAQKVLINYIELASRGNNKKSIMKYIDDLVLA